MIAMTMGYQYRGHFGIFRCTIRDVGSDGASMITDLLVCLHVIKKALFANPEMNLSIDQCLPLNIVFIIFFDGIQI